MAAIAGPDGAQLHLLQVTATPMTQFSWENTCTTPVETVNFTATLPGGDSVTNGTKCEYIIRNISISLRQDGHDMTPDEPGGAIHLSTALPSEVRLQIQEGAPVLMNWDYGTTDLENGTQDLQARVNTDEYYSQTVTYPQPGTFVINASATNTHSDTLGATWATQEVIVQNPVLEAWDVRITNTEILAEPINGLEAEVQFLFTLPDTERLPTDAFIYAHFGDTYHMTEFEPLSDYGYVITAF